MAEKRKIRRGKNINLDDLPSTPHEKRIREVNPTAEMSDEERDAQQRMLVYINECLKMCRKFLHDNGADPVIGAYVAINMAGTFMSEVPWAAMPQDEWDAIFDVLRKILTRHQNQIKRPGTPEY